MQLPTAMTGHAGDPLPPGAAAMVAAPNIIPPIGHKAMWLLACEVASGLDTTWRYRYEALALMPPANTDKVVEYPRVAGAKRCCARRHAHLYPLGRHWCRQHASQ